jgi:hypothetical protein
VFWNFKSYTGVWGCVEHLAQLEPIRQGKEIFKAPLGVTTGYDGMHMSFYESGYKENKTECFTPLFSKYLIALVKYYDIFGRQYITVVTGDGTTTKRINDSTLAAEMESLNTLSSAQIEEANLGVLTKEILDAIREKKLTALRIETKD